MAQNKSIAKSWIDAFLDAMKMDLTKKTYARYKDLQKYMYGSAEVIGLMMMVLIGYDKSQEKKIIV